MQAFDENWTAEEGKTEIDLGEKAQVQINVSCTQDVQVLGVRGQEKIPLKIGREYRFKVRTGSFEKLIIQGKPKTPYGLRIQYFEMQDGEPINDDNPPAPPMPGADNLLLQMRQIVQAEMKRNSSPVLDPEDLPFASRYEVDDEDYDFEEEILLASQQSAEADGETDPPVAEPQPHSAAEPPADGEEPPPVAQAAE